MNRSGRNVLHGRLKATAVERTYVIQRLTQRRVDQVYPLVQLARPHVTLAAWRDLCARRIADSENLALPPGGILLAVDKADYVRGLCSYTVGAPESAQQVLRVEIGRASGRERVCKTCRYRWAPTH